MPIKISVIQATHHVAYRLKCPVEKQKENVPMLWTIVLVLVVLWALGLIGSVGGGMVHILLVLAAIVVLFNLFSRRRSIN